MNKVLLVLSLFFCLSVSAQRPHCGTYEYIQEQNGLNPLYSEQLRIAREQALEYENDPANQSSRAGVIFIPVVFHVMHTGEAIGTGKNLSDAQLISQIEALNRDFRKRNSDTTSIPGVFSGRASDCEIEFCLASFDPSGSPTSGITRHNIGTSAFNDSRDKPSTIWNSTKYLNIWTAEISGGLLGYTTPPGGTTSQDGMVLGYQYVGIGGSSVRPYNKGRTATHEAGHWLGLDHIWGDDGGACSGSDGISDTPNQGGENYGCPAFPNVSCSNGPNGDMFMNYMDYTDDACMFMFTAGQKSKMVSVLNTSRSGIKTSTGCGTVPSFPFSGTVIDAATSAPVPNAKVFFEGTGNYEATTNASGNFTIASMLTGTYDVYAGKWGYMTRFYLDNTSINSTTPAYSIPILNHRYYDDFTLDLGWSYSATAISGTWTRDYPVASLDGAATSNPGTDDGTDFSGKCFVTGNAAPGDSPGTNDVDGGNVTLASPVFDLTSYADPYIQYSRWFYNAAGTTPVDDHFQVSLSDGVSSVDLENMVFANGDNDWIRHQFRVRDYIAPGSTMRLTIQTGDLGTSNLVEAGFDKFEVLDSNELSVRNLEDVSSEIMLYPNPAHGSFEVWVKNVMGADEFELSLFNSLGEKVMGRKAILSSGQSYHLDPWPLSPGLYLFEAVNRSSYSRKKILIY